MYQDYNGNRQNVGISFMYQDYNENRQILGFLVCTEAITFQIFAPYTVLRHKFTCGWKCACGVHIIM